MTASGALITVLVQSREGILTEEGYITLNGSTPTYHYYLKDHLGNVRVVMNQNGSTVEQSNNYYPFGGIFDATGDWEQPYKFGGKEYDPMHGLNWCDFGNRQLRNDAPGWMSIDPLCEKYYSISPYAYCFNNPIKYVDPDGKQGLFFGISNFPVFGSSNPLLLGANDVIKVTPRATPKVETHHIIPKQLKGNSVLKQAREGGFKLDGKENKVSLEKFSKATGKGQHGNHPQYSKQVGEKLNKYQTENKNFTPEQAADFVKNESSSIREQILNNPEVKLNDLKLNEVVLPKDNTDLPLPIIKEEIKEYVKLK